MNFSQLKSIIKNIKTHVVCPKCQMDYSNDDLHVISSIGNRCLVVAKCSECQTPIMITAVVKYEANNSEKEEIITEHESIIELPEDVITPDDVVNVHKFLDNYSGDFRKLFDGN